MASRSTVPEMPSADVLSQIDDRLAQWSDKDCLAPHGWLQDIATPARMLVHSLRLGGAFWSPVSLAHYVVLPAG